MFTLLRTTFTTLKYLLLLNAQVAKSITSVSGGISVCYKRFVPQRSLRQTREEAAVHLFRVKLTTTGHGSIHGQGALRSQGTTHALAPTTYLKLHGFQQVQTLTFSAPTSHDI